MAFKLQPKGVAMESQGRASVRDEVIRILSGTTNSDPLQKLPSRTGEIPTNALQKLPSRTNKITSNAFEKHKGVAMKSKKCKI